MLGEFVEGGRGRYFCAEKLEERESSGVWRAKLGESGAGAALKWAADDAKGWLRNEARMYRLVKESELGRDFLRLEESFERGGRLWLVLEEAGRSLEQLRRLCGGRLSLKTTLLLAQQMLARAAGLHALGLLHGDLKPHNFAIGKGKLRHKVYLIDLELTQPLP